MIGSHHIDHLIDPVSVPSSMVFETKFIIIEFLQFNHIIEMINHGKSIKFKHKLTLKDGKVVLHIINWSHHIDHLTQIKQPKL